MIATGLACLAMGLIATSQSASFGRALDARVQALPADATPETHVTLQEILKGMGKIKAEASTIFYAGVGITSGGVGMLLGVHALAKVKNWNYGDPDWIALSNASFG